MTVNVPTALGSAVGSASVRSTRIYLPRPCSSLRNGIADSEDHLGPETWSMSLALRRSQRSRFTSASDGSLTQTGDMPDWYTSTSSSVTYPRPSSSGTADATDQMPSPTSTKLNVPSVAVVSAASVPWIRTGEPTTGRPAVYDDPRDAAADGVHHDGARVRRGLLHDSPGVVVSGDHPAAEAISTGPILAPGSNGSVSVYSRFARSGVGTVRALGHQCERNSPVPESMPFTRRPLVSNNSTIAPSTEVLVAPSNTVLRTSCRVGR